MNEEVRQMLDKIKNLKDNDLEFYQKLMNFLEFIGLSSQDVLTLVTLIKTFPEFIQKINSVIEDQKFINNRLNGTDTKSPNPIEQFNKDRTYLNPYGTK